MRRLLISTGRQDQLEKSWHPHCYFLNKCERNKNSQHIQDDDILYLTIIQHLEGIQMGIRKEHNHQRRITFSHKFFQPLTKAWSITKIATMTYAYRAVWILRDIPDKANIRAMMTMENNAISCMIGVNFR